MDDSLNHQLEALQTGMENNLAWIAGRLEHIQGHTHEIAQAIKAQTGALRDLDNTLNAILRALSSLR